MMPDKFYHDQPPVAMATTFQTKSAITQLILETSVRRLRLSAFFGVVLSNDVSQILQRRTLVAMATKFETKQSITLLV